jgi:5-deoxy-glucuronate isomerase
MSESKYGLTESTCVVRGTGAKQGRTQWMAPGTAALRHPTYGRIILDAGLDAVGAPLRFATGVQETGLVCLAGKGTVRLSDGSVHQFGKYDSLYVPRDFEVEVAATGPHFDLAEISAPVEGKYPVQYVGWAQVQADPGLHFKTGGEASMRNLNILLGKNIEAGRIVAGVTFSEPGHWTSWPPHEHAAMLEKAYLYIDMPAPAWGVQFVYTNPQQPELMVAVRQDDAVAIPQGYHPNVAAPGGTIGFLWMMAANREREDRKFGVVNVQPEYAHGKSGLESGR